MKKRILEVPDPYYGGEQGFEQVLDLVEKVSDPLMLKSSIVCLQEVL